MYIIYYTYVLLHDSHVIRIIMYIYESYVLYNYLIIIIIKLYYTAAA